VELVTFVACIRSPSITMYDGVGIASPGVEAGSAVKVVGLVDFAMFASRKYGGLNGAVL
jgi:hypothetical protein